MIVTEQEEKIRMELLTPLAADLVPYELLEDETWEDIAWDQMPDGYPLGCDDLVQYKDSIQEMVDRENLLCSEDGKPCNLMAYFTGSPVIAQKVESAVVSVKEVNDALYGCTTLVLKDYLNSDEKQELYGYITGQYSDGWGEGFEQRDIAVEDGTLNVHFWQYSEKFRFREKTVGLPQKAEEPLSSSVSHPKLKLLGRDGNIFSIMGDARRLLVANGQGKEADEMTKRVQSSDNYYMALNISSEYVETELSGPKCKKRKPQRPGKEDTCR